MSDAKREHSEFRHPATAGRHPLRFEALSTELLLTAESAELRVLEPWEIGATPGGDPYNGVGSRAAVGHGRRK